jgi:hypothetical protein
LAARSAAARRQRPTSVAADTTGGVPSDTKFGAHPTPRRRLDA